MDVGLASMVYNQAQVKQQASMSVMKTAMDGAEQNADALNKMLEGANESQKLATDPHRGRNIDMKI
ncbi:YjfB family protein [Desertibacillus haloalkaliphilus]|uniref:YjfB family protein n=1 Tax=Desertibacillus haloalkaliphilus TaxID=1328930 RepID=UPI001C272C83|nr:YjfB family protein [Desertibacillus haloalkaliphilus]MBU8906010.1 YjfB family protein [Desertibacillus haloalkaliphilus]